MINRELTEYIRKERLRGVSDEEIKKVLSDAGGWDPVDIVEGFTAVPSDLTDSSNIRLSEIGHGEEVLGAKQKGGTGTSSKLKPILVTILVIILLAGAGGAAAYVYYTQFAERMSPYEVLRASIESTRDIKSVSSSAEMEASGSIEVTTLNYGLGEDTSRGIPDPDVVTEGVAETVKFELDYSVVSTSSVKFNDPDIEKADMVASFSASGQFGPFSVDLSGDILIKILDGTIYVKADIPSLSDLPTSKEIEQYLGRWISIDISEYQKLNDLYTQSNSEYQNEKLITDLKSYFSGGKFGELIKSGILELEDEKLDGSKLHHYSISFTREQWTTFFDDLEQIYKENVDEVFYEYPVIDPGEEAWDIIYGILKGISIELWIDKGVEKYPRRVVIDIPVKFNEKIGDDKLNVDIVLRYDFNITDINEDFTVVAPADATPLEEIVGGPLGGGIILETARARARDDKRIFDIKQSQLALELYFDQQNPSRYPIQAIQGALPSVIVGGNRLGDLPEDPLGVYVYQYRSNSIGTKYCVGAVMENEMNFLNTCEGVSLDDRYNFTLGVGTSSTNSGTGAISESGEEPNSGKSLIQTMSDYANFLGASLINADENKDENN